MDMTEAMTDMNVTDGIIVAIVIAIIIISVGLATKDEEDNNKD